MSNDNCNPAYLIKATCSDLLLLTTIVGQVIAAGFSITTANKVLNNYGTVLGDYGDSLNTVKVLDGIMIALPFFAILSTAAYYRTQLKAKNIINSQAITAIVCLFLNLGAYAEAQKVEGFPESLTNYPDIEAAIKTLKYIHMDAMLPIMVIMSMVGCFCNCHNRNSDDTSTSFILSGCSFIYNKLALCFPKNEEKQPLIQPEHKI